jgi:hypothetical protein
MPTTGEIVRATGLCSMCDFKFRDEVVARYPDRSMPGGWAYIELRHLDADAVEALEGVSVHRASPQYVTAATGIGRPPPPPPSSHMR